jgi:tetratricopeptide (TPR) repeat protein
MSNLQTRLLLCLLLGLPGRLSAETELEKAARLIKEKNFPQAQALLDRAVQTDPRNAEAWYQLAELQWASRNPRKAVECVDKAIQLSPNKAGYHVLRGNALGNLAQNANMFSAMGLAKDACAALEKAVQLEPGNRVALLALFNFYFNAPSIAGGGLDKAEALAARSLALDPSRAHFMKGQIRKKQKDPGAAQAEYRLALAADPKFSAVYNLLGYVELEMKQVDMALEHFRKQVELDPGNANSYDSLGDGLVAKGRLDEAIETYRKGLALNPLFTASLRSLGKVLEQTGRRDEAIQHYRQCVQLGAQKGIPTLAEEARKRLKALGVSG